MNDLLIEADALQATLSDKNLRVFDTAVTLKPAARGYTAESGLADYEQAHIPGAGFIDLISAFSDTSTGLGFTLPGYDELQSAIGGVGIGAGHDVVLYSSGHMMWATRAWWLLRAAGHNQVRVLNGGLSAWQEAGFDVSSGSEGYPPAEFNGDPRPNLFVDLAGMVAAEGRACTVNALSDDMYLGEGDFNYGRPGHIPGSLHLHYDDLLDGNAFKPLEALRTALGERGLLDADRVVTYCGGGIAATVDGFACLLVGQSNVAVYDGSMSEWVQAGKPLKTGREP